MSYYLDCSHTSHCRANTGIQRVARSWYKEVLAAQDWSTIAWDPYQDTWRPLLVSEEVLMDFDSATKPYEKRSKNWTSYQRMRGRWLRLCGDKHTLEKQGWCITAEIFDEERFAEYKKLQAQGMRVGAVFHDAIPLILPDLTPQKTVNRFKVYLQELAQLDAVFPVSEDSKEQLQDYWRVNNIQFSGCLEVIPLAVSFPRINDARVPKQKEVLDLLTVGSLEGRKNHLAWLQAAERLWQEGYRFTLNIVGMLNRETGSEAAQLIEKLEQAGRPIQWHRCVSDDELLAFYDACDFTVYPSVYEGFGLPVLESLYYGKPCVCLGRGATGEVAAQGGCFPLQEVDVNALMNGVKSLLDNPQTLSSLQDECKHIHFRSWREYVKDVETFLT